MGRHSLCSNRLDREDLLDAYEVSVEGFRGEKIFLIFTAIISRFFTAAMILSRAP